MGALKFRPGMKARITYGEDKGRECEVKGYFAARNKYLVKIVRPGNPVAPVDWRHIKPKFLEKA